MPLTTAEFCVRAALFIALALVPVLIWVLFDVVLIATGAVLVAVLLHVVARPFRRILPRAFALVIAGLLLLAVLGGVFYLFGSSLGDELQEILRRAGEGQHQLTSWLESSSLGKTVLAHVRQDNFSVTGFIGKAFKISASLLAGVIVAIVAGVFFAAEPGLYRDGLSLLFPSSVRPAAEETLEYLAGALRLWLLGQLLEMALVGVMVGFSLWLVGLPPPLALGAIATVAQFVPYVGPIVSFIPSALVATTVSWNALFWTAIAYALIHQVDGYLIMPIIQRRMVSVPPALMLLSIVTLSELFGPIATIFAAPMTVLIYVLVTKLWVRDALHEEIVVPGEADAQEELDARNPEETP